MDGDGESDEGELKTLAEMGVTSISTQYTGKLGQKHDEHGNDISLESTFTRVVDGEEKTLKTVDAFFVNRDAVTAETIDASSLDALTSSLLESFKEYAEIKDASYVPPAPASNTAADGSQSAAQTELEKELEAAREAEERRKAFVSSQVELIEGEKSSLESDLSLVDSELSSLESSPETEDEEEFIPVPNNAVEDSSTPSATAANTSRTVTRNSDDSNASARSSAQSRQTYLSSEISSRDSEISRLKADIS